jgi:hypothetical protein
MCPTYRGVQDIGKGKNLPVRLWCISCAVYLLSLHKLTTVGLLELRNNGNINNNNNNNVLKPTTMHCILHLRLNEILNVQNVFF